MGFADSTAVAVVSGTDLSPLFAADTTAVEGGNLITLAWSADGRRLLAAGRGFTEEGLKAIRYWDQQGRGPLQTLPLSAITDTVMDLQPLGDGRLVVAAADPAWAVLDGAGRPRAGQGPPILDHRGNFDAFRLSPPGAADGLEFQQKTWRNGRWHRRLARFDLSTRQLQRDVQPASGWRAPRTTGLPIAGWFDTTKPRLGETPLPLEPYEISRSLAVAPDNKRFALGTDWSVQFFDARGQRIWRRTCHRWPGW